MASKCFKLCELHRDLDCVRLPEFLEKSLEMACVTRMSAQVFEVTAERSLTEDELKQNGGASAGENEATGAAAEAEGKEKEKKKSKEQEVDGENGPTMPDELDLAQRHPMDPHKPNFSDLLPEPLRPYPSFEGWFVRIWDSHLKASADVILATNYATVESQVTLLFAPGHDVDRDGGRHSVKHGYTYAVDARTKVSPFFTPPIS